MRVLVVIFEKLVPISGGGTPRISSLVKAFVARGHEVHVASSIAVSKEEAAEEISQLLYHLQVMMVASDITLEDVYRYL